MPFTRTARVALLLLAAYIEAPQAAAQSAASAAAQSPAYQEHLASHDAGDHAPHDSTPTSRISRATEARPCCNPTMRSAICRTSSGSCVDVTTAHLAALARCTIA